MSRYQEEGVEPWTQSKGRLSLQKKSDPRQGRRCYVKWVVNTRDHSEQSSLITEKNESSGGTRRLLYFVKLLLGPQTAGLDLAEHRGRLWSLPCCRRFEPLLEVREKIFTLLNPPKQNQPSQINIASRDCFPNVRGNDLEKWKALFKSVDVCI